FADFVFSMLWPLINTKGATMESLIELLGTMFFMFLVLAAAVEVILEMFRGVLERVGITWAKGKFSLDEALRLSSEFAPDNKDLHTKIQAVKFAAQQLTKTAGKKIEELTQLQTDLAAAGANVNEIVVRLNDAANSVKNSLEDAERRRIFVLRFLAALIGAFLAWKSGFYVLQILASDTKVAKLFITFDKLLQTLIQ